MLLGCGDLNIYVRGGVKSEKGGWQAPLILMGKDSIFFLCHTTVFCFYLSVSR